MKRIPVCVAAAVALLTTSCSLVGGGDDDSGADASRRVVLVTHESFVMSKALQRQFEEESGYDLVIKASGDGGALTNKLVLTKDDPTGDAVFGIDNTFGSRAVDEGVLAPYAAQLPAGAEQYVLPGDDDHDLTPIDTGSVCVNVDDTWFADKGIPEPETLDDLLDPAYQDLFVTPGATTSSPGLAFLLATISSEGDAWPTYWKKLVANGVKVDAGWTDAYEVDFTGGGGKGTRPIVLSYSSSPPFTIPKGASRPTTSALLDTCFRQVEYAGVLTGSKNPAGMRMFIDFMQGRDFQAALPDNMYVYPVDADVALPSAWAKFAPISPKPYAIDPVEVTENRSAWLREWRDITTR